MDNFQDVHFLGLVLFDVSFLHQFSMIRGFALMGGVHRGEIYTDLARLALTSPAATLAASARRALARDWPEFGGRDTRQVPAVGVAEPAPTSVKRGRGRTQLRSHSRGTAHRPLCNCASPGARGQPSLRTLVSPAAGGLQASASSWRRNEEGVTLTRPSDVSLQVKVRIPLAPAPAGRPRPLCPPSGGPLSKSKDRACPPSKTCGPFMAKTTLVTRKCMECVA